MPGGAGRQDGGEIVMSQRPSEAEGQGEAWELWEPMWREALEASALGDGDLALVMIARRGWDEGHNQDGKGGGVRQCWAVWRSEASARALLEGLRQALIVSDKDTAARWSHDRSRSPVPWKEGLARALRAGAPWGLAVRETDGEALGLESALNELAAAGYAAGPANLGPSQGAWIFDHEAGRAFEALAEALAVGRSCAPGRSPSVGGRL